MFLQHQITFMYTPTWGAADTMTDALKQQHEGESYTIQRVTRNVCLKIEVVLVHASSEQASLGPVY